MLRQPFVTACRSPGRSTNLGTIYGWLSRNRWSCRVRLAFSHRWCLILAFCLSVVPGTAVNSADIPSCTDIALGRSKPGASPPCAPQIIDNDRAFQILKNAEQISFKWYVLRSESDWKRLPHSQLWFSLATTVSAIQSLYDMNSDVLFVVPPSNDLEKLMLLQGQYPLKKIKAHARYMMSETLGLIGKRPEGYPPGHKERLYTLIVY